MLKTTSTVLFVHYSNTSAFLMASTRHGFFQMFLKHFRQGQVHPTCFHKQDKQNDGAIRRWKRVGDCERETGWRWRKRRRRGGWGCGRKKVKEIRGRKIERVIPNDCCFYCSLAPRHSGGSDRHNLFLCKSPFTGSLSSSFSTTSLPPTVDLPPALRPPLAILDSLTFLLFHPHSSFT